MKKLLPLVVCLFIISCSTSSPNINKLSYTAPIKLGENWAKKMQLMGTPDKTGDNFYSFFSKGIIVYTTANGSSITGLVFTWFKGAQHFEGEVYGIKLGDTYPKVTRLWGEPIVGNGTPHADYYDKTWQFKKLKIVVEFWSHTGDDVDLGGHYETDTVKRIQITS